MPDEPKKPGPKTDPAVHEKRIEYVRFLLRQSRTKGDIKRSFKQMFRIKSVRLFNKYYGAAQRRNLEAVEKTEDENLSETLAYWQGIMQECEEQILRCRREDEGYDKPTAEGPIRVAGNLERIAQAEKVLYDKEADPDSKEDARRILDLATQRLEQNRIKTSGAQRRSMDARRELDGILGTKAPTKFARTDSKGKDLPNLTDAEIVERMLQLGMEPMKFINAKSVEPRLIANGSQHGQPEPLYRFHSGSAPGSGEVVD